MIYEHGHDVILVQPNWLYRRKRMSWRLSDNQIIFFTQSPLYLCPCQNYQESKYWSWSCQILWLMIELLMIMMTALTVRGLNLLRQISIWQMQIFCSDFQLTSLINISCSYGYMKMQKLSIALNIQNSFNFILYLTDSQSWLMQ